MASHSKTRLISLLLALLFLLSACGKKEDSSAGSSSLSTSEGLSSSAVLSDASAASGASGASAPQGSSLAAKDPAPAAAPLPPALDALSLGTFACLDTEGFYPDERAPYLELLDSEGLASFQVNTGTEVGLVEGTAYLQGSTLTFTFQELPIENEFWGSDLTSISFVVQDADHLEFTGRAFGLAQRQMIFVRQEPASPQASALPQGAGAPAPEPQSLAPNASTPGTKEEPSALSGAADSSLASEPDASVSASTSTSADGDPSAEDPATPTSEKSHGIPLWLAIAVAVASAAVGGVGAVFLVATLKKRRDNKEARLAAAAEKKEQKAAAAVQKKEEKQTKAEEQKEKRQEAKQARQEKQEEQKKKQDAKKAARLEKKASREAAKKEKKARSAAKKAAKAADEAEAAAKKASEAAQKSGGGGAPVRAEKVEKVALVDTPDEDEGQEPPEAAPPKSAKEKKGMPKGKKKVVLGSDDGTDDPEA